MCKALQRLGSVSSMQSQLGRPSSCVSFRTDSRDMLVGDISRMICYDERALKDWSDVGGLIGPSRCFSFQFS